MMEMIGESEDPTAFREQLNTAIIRGELSVEDGEEVLDSIQIRTDSDFKRQEYRFADKSLTDSVTDGFGFNKRN